MDAEENWKKRFLENLDQSSTSDSITTVVPSNPPVFQPAPTEILPKPEPIQEPSKPEPVQEPSKPEPVQEPSKPEPVQEPSKPEPVQEAPAPQPIQELPIPELVQEPPKPEPVQEAPAPQPIQEQSEPVQQESSKPVEQEPPTLSELHDKLKTKKSSLQQSFGNKNYLDSIVKLDSVSTHFLTSLKESKIKTLSVTGRGRIDELIDKVSEADLGTVSSMNPDLASLKIELTKLIHKFQLIRKNYKEDASLKSFMGNYEKDTNYAYKRLLRYVDGCIVQTDATITAYSRVLRSMSAPRNWIKTVLSHYSSASQQKKAQDARKILHDLEKIIEEIRTVCQDAKIQLIELRTIIYKASGLSKSS